MEIASIVLASLSLAGSIISPLIISAGAFITRIKKSDCCFGGAHIEMDSPKNPPLNLDPNQPQVPVPQVEPTPSFMNKIQNLLKK